MKIITKDEQTKPIEKNILEIPVNTTFYAKFFPDGSERLFLMGISQLIQLRDGLTWDKIKENEKNQLMHDYSPVKATIVVDNE